MDQNDPFWSHFYKALTYSIDPSLRQQEGFERLEPDQSPLTFYDLHIASNLSCRQVIDSPQIIQILSKVCDDAVEKFYKDGERFSADGYALGTPDILLSSEGYLEDVESVSELYQRYAGRIGALYASKFVDPETTWDCIFKLVSNPSENKFVVECTTDIFREEATPGLFSSNLRARFRIGPHIAVWQFFPMSETGKSIVRQIASGPVLWETLRTKGTATTSSTKMLLDAPRSSPWILGKDTHEQDKKGTQKKAPAKAPTGKKLTRKTSRKKAPAIPPTQAKSGEITITRKSTRATARRFGLSH